jgi:hypothetical protein
MVYVPTYKQILPSRSSLLHEAVRFLANQGARPSVLRSSRLYFYNVYFAPGLFIHRQGPLI